MFRSFPFRAPAAPIDDSVDSLIEETQAPPPAYSSLVREPEEAGEVTPAQPDPENVGEDSAGAQPAVRKKQNSCYFSHSLRCSRVDLVSRENT